MKYPFVYPVLLPLLAAGISCAEQTRNDAASPPPPPSTSKSTPPGPSAANERPPAEFGLEENAIYQLKKRVMTRFEEKAAALRAGGADLADLLEKLAAEDSPRA